MLFFTYAHMNSSTNIYERIRSNRQDVQAFKAITFYAMTTHQSLDTIPICLRDIARRLAQHADCTDAEIKPCWRQPALAPGDQTAMSRRRQNGDVEAEAGTNDSTMAYRKPSPAVRSS